MPYVPIHKGNVLFSKNKYVHLRKQSIGSGFMDLNPVSKTINRIGGIKDLDDLSHIATKPVQKILSNFKNIPNLGGKKVLNSISVPLKRLNNLKFEL